MKGAFNAIAIVAVVVGVETAFIGGFVCGYSFHKAEMTEERSDSARSSKRYYYDFGRYSKKKQEENDGN